MNHSSRKRFTGSSTLWVAATRDLRGGSGGGTSGGGGGSSGQSSNESYGDGTDSGPLPIWISVIGGIGAFLFAAFYVYKCQNRRRNKELFEEAVNSAKNDVEQKRQASLSNERILPHSGEYSTEYLDRGTKRNGSITLSFHDKGSSDGYILSGSGIDADGCTTITEGHVNYNGTAWWKEKNTTGDVGMLVLSTGKFDFVGRAFTGEWYSSTNIKGTYTSFSAKDPPVSAPTESDTSDEGKDVNVAMDPDYVVPIVSAVPSQY